MAVQTPIRPPAVPAGAPNYAAVGASDTIPVAGTGRYLLIVKNAGGTPDNVVVVDPTSAPPEGATFTGGSPSIAHTVPATTGERHFFLDAQRHRDVNGNIVVTHSFQTTVTCIVYGPLS